MKCRICGKELEGPTPIINGMCWECFEEKANKTEKLHAGWECPKCGYVWAVWVEGCSNCNQPEYEVKTASFTGDEPYASEIKP